MEKKVVIVLIVLFILVGCKNNKQASCILDFEDKTISLDIKAINDDISSINVRTSFVIPNSVINNKDRFDFLSKQITQGYHFEDNLLVKEYEVQLDDIYSFKKTIEYLNSKRYFCE